MRAMFHNRWPPSHSTTTDRGNCFLFGPYLRSPCKHSGRSSPPTPVSSNHPRPQRTGFLIPRSDTDNPTQPFVSRLCRYSDILTDCLPGGLSPHPKLLFLYLRAAQLSRASHRQPWQLHQSVFIFFAHSGHALVLMDRNNVVHSCCMISSITRTCAKHTESFGHYSPSHIFAKIFPSPPPQILP